MQLSYKERNKMFYEVLKHYKICVIPSSKVESYDRLPHFQIIESNLNLIRRLPGKLNKRTGSIESPKKDESKGKVFDTHNTKGTIDLFKHLNEIQLHKFNFEKSQSLRVKKKKSGAIGQFGGL